MTDTLVSKDTDFLQSCYRVSHNQVIALPERAEIGLIRT